jgi:ABC-type antimicrobial peptide transport system permease subunit
LPGVQAVAYAQNLPMIQMGRVTPLRTTPEELVRPPVPGARLTANTPDTRIVSQDYFAAMGIRLVAGRVFAEADGAGQPGVMLINQTLWRSRFLGDDPIGRRVYGAGSEPWEIIGIVEDVRQFGFDQEPEPQIFVDFRQWPLPGDAPEYYAVRTVSDPQETITRIRSILRQMDPQVTLHSAATMDELVSNSVSRSRLYAALTIAFGGVAALLAVAGVFSLVACAVTQRTREIAIRIVLGAPPGSVVSLLLRETLMLSAIGIGIGMVCAMGTMRYMSSMLYGLTPLDPATYLAVAAVFAVVVVRASSVAARRITQVDPLVAIRDE